MITGMFIEILLPKRIQVIVSFTSIVKEVLIRGNRRKNDKIEHLVLYDLFCL